LITREVVCPARPEDASKTSLQDAISRRHMHMAIKVVSTPRPLHGHFNETADDRKYS
jgi:hypothetical protein